MILWALPSNPRLHSHLDSDGAAISSRSVRVTFSNPGNFELICCEKTLRIDGADPFLVTSTLRKTIRALRTVSPLPVSTTTFLMNAGELCQVVAISLIYFYVSVNPSGRYCISTGREQTRTRPPKYLMCQSRCTNIRPWWSHGEEKITGMKWGTGISHDECCKVVLQDISFLSGLGFSLDCSRVGEISIQFRFFSKGMISVEAYYLDAFWWLACN